jgi:hypothetical protein
MSPIDLIQMLRVKPFGPFRIYASDGRTYDIYHPDQALVLLTRVILPLKTNGEIPERSEHLALSHIVRIEELPAHAPSAESAE